MIFKKMKFQTCKKEKTKEGRKRGLINKSKNQIKKTRYISKLIILDDIRDWKNSNIISNIYNNFVAFLMKKYHDKENDNHKMNIIHANISLVASEVLNQVFEKPVSIYDHINMFIKIVNDVYKITIYYNEKIKLFELKEKECLMVSSSSLEYIEFLEEYPKIKNIYKNDMDYNNILGKKVQVVIDRMIGSIHPTNDMKYELNYGYIPGVYTFDGEEQDAYIIDEVNSVREYEGRVVAIIHRKDDIENKWVVSNKNKKYTKDEIQKSTNFQEQYFDIEIEILE